MESYALSAGLSAVLEEQMNAGIPERAYAE